MGRIVDVELKGKSYKRDVGIIRYNGKNINIEMVKGGYAWIDKRYLGGSYVDYLLAEKEAREARRGLWKYDNPVSPREFRSKKR